MTLATDELLRRLARAVRDEIAPAVRDEYLRTQAFMVSVILERVANEQALATAHAEAEAADLAELWITVEPALVAAPPAVATAYAEARTAGTVAALALLIAALHSWPGADGSAALGAIRTVLRRDIDRRMVIAR